MDPLGTYWATASGDIIQQGLSSRRARPALSVRSRTEMNLCFLLISFSISASSVQVDLRPKPLPCGGCADANTFVRNYFRERRIISRSFSASAARNSSSLLPRYLDNSDPALA
jgi:hypothetical protein